MKAVFQVLLQASCVAPLGCLLRVPHSQEFGAQQQCAIATRTKQNTFVCNFAHAPALAQRAPMI